MLAGMWWWMRKGALKPGVRPSPSLTNLGFRNASRHPVRSLLTIGLLAAASFMVVAVQAFHRDPTHDFLEKTGGSGGYAWIGEATVPIFQDLNTTAGRAETHLPPDIAATFVPLRVQAGDDASCLNLYRPRQPRIVGVPRKLIDRGGLAGRPHEGKGDGLATLCCKHPRRRFHSSHRRGEYRRLDAQERPRPGHHHSGWPRPTGADGRGDSASSRLLQDSVFQSELLIAEDNFLKLFPRQEGFQLFLIDAPPGEPGQHVRRVVENALADYGFSMTPAEQRLQSYLDVENTYLATFQALGGLGLLLGTLGLAVVLVRSVWERRGELALLRALGFRRSALGLLVLAENAWLLVLGLVFGCTAAAIAIAPFVASQGGDVLQPRVLVLLGLVIVAGLAAGALAMRAALQNVVVAGVARLPSE